MNVVQHISETTHREALLVAREVGQGPGLGYERLAAPQADAVETWFRKIWDQLSSAVQEAANGASAAAQELKAQALLLWEQASAELGHGLSVLRDKLVAAMDAYVKQVIDRAIAVLRPSIAIGSSNLGVRSIKIAQTVKLSTSVKASIEDLISFAGEGQISITADYGTGD